VVESVLMYDIMHSCTVISELYAQVLRSGDNSKKRSATPPRRHYAYARFDGRSTLDVLGAELGHER